MGSVNPGFAKSRGDFGQLYQVRLKQANSMILKFTDDDLGPGTGVNVKVHAIRADFGLTRFLRFQNLLIIQRGLSVMNGAANDFFVPVQAGANRTLSIFRPTGLYVLNCLFGKLEELYD